jgi:hypothetical protein
MAKRLARIKLGVVDIPYVENETKQALSNRVKAGKKNPHSRPPGTAISTGDVAEILEAKYGIMKRFFKAKEKEIRARLEEDIRDALETLMATGHELKNPFGDTEAKIKELFSDFLSLREIERLGIPGVPTKAAQRGVNHRMKRPYVKRGPRPSFIDTGLFEASFAAEIEK